MEPKRTDEALMLAYQAGDASAFEELYARWKGKLFRYIKHQCKNASYAEELYQDVWLKIIGARMQYEITAKFSTWLFRIAHNRIIDHWRSSGRQATELLASYENNADEDAAKETIESIPASANETPERKAERKVMAEKMLQAIQTLPAAQRETFLLVEEGEMTLEEIASTMGTTRETAKSRLRYALNKLRAELKEWQ